MTFPVQTSTVIHDIVLAALSRIAPEAALGQLDPGEDIREQLDLDSVDFLNFVVALHGELGVEVPEADYRKLRTIDGCVRYLMAAVKS
jgi:acyl carrier protein